MIARSSISRRRRAFSLVEVLLATFILAIGLIMVATIFPVGADWTRQATEANVAQVVAQNALNVIKQRYSHGGVLSSQLASITTTTVAPLPGLTNISVAERTYLFGNSRPYPTANPRSATYFWTALARISPSQASSLSPSYDLYIVVFRKGEAAQKFTAFPTGTTEVLGARDNTDPTYPSGTIIIDHTLEPTLCTANYATGNYDKTQNPPVLGAVPPIGFAGIGVTSGTVFRQQVNLDPIDTTKTKAVARPGISSGEQVIYAPPADGTNASPLVYVYQTTLTF
jgi:type II secretory pathway pseudopilin PulG